MSEKIERCPSTGTLVESFLSSKETLVADGKGDASFPFLKARDLKRDRSKPSTLDINFTSFKVWRKPELLGSARRCLRSIYKHRWLEDLRTRREAANRSQCLDRYLQEESKNLPIVVIMFGVRAPHCPWFYSILRHEVGDLSIAERIEWKDEVVTLAVRPMRHLLYQMHDMKIPVSNESVEGHANAILSLEDGQITKNDSLAREISEAISTLWNDSAIHSFSEAWHEKSCFLTERDDHFFKEIPRIFSPGYVPRDVDIRHVFQPLSNFYGSGRCLSFDDRDLPRYVVELGGARGERKKWIHHIENASIIYTVDLTEYNKSLCEDKTINRIQQSCVTWGSIFHSKWLQSSRFALCFAKSAKFANMVRIKPIDGYMKGYQLDDPSDPEKAREYIAGLFMAQAKDGGRARVKLHFMEDLPSPEDWSAIRDFLISRAPNAG